MYIFTKDQQLFYYLYLNFFLFQIKWYIFLSSSRYWFLATIYCLSINLSLNLYIIHIYYFSSAVVYTSHTYVFFLQMYIDIFTLTINFLTHHIFSWRNNPTSCILIMLFTCYSQSKNTNFNLMKKRAKNNSR